MNRHHTGFHNEHHFGRPHETIILGNPFSPYPMYPYYDPVYAKYSAAIALAFIVIFLIIVLVSVVANYVRNAVNTEGLIRPKSVITGKFLKYDKHFDDQ